MKFLLNVCIIGALSISPVFHVARANPDLHHEQPVAGWADHHWSFMSAWNLATGHLQVSPVFYSGRLVWGHAAPKTQWIGRFVYDQAAGQTTELAWYYSQWHTQ